MQQSPFSIPVFPNPIEYGVGNWRISSFLALNVTKYDQAKIFYPSILKEGKDIAIHGSGVLTNLMQNVGFSRTLFYFRIYYFTKRFTANERRALIPMIVLLYETAFIHSIGEPLRWNATALILNFNERKWRGKRDIAEPIPV